MADPPLPTPGEWVRLSDQVRRLTQDNPSVFTGSGTNTYLIGQDPIWILDPGPDDEDHFECLTKEVAQARVLGVVCSHSHPDHWPMAPRLAARFSTQTWGFEARNGYEPQRCIADGETLAEGGPVLEAIHTPGHARDHLCFLLAEEEVLFSGDHVMGWSTTVIAPPGGNLNDYTSSLDKIDRHPYELMYPAHGNPIADPSRRIDALRRHRRLRTNQALGALKAGLQDLPTMVDRIYLGLDPKLHKAAQGSLLAHLLALVGEGRVVVLEEAEEPVKARYALAAVHGGAHTSRTGFPA